MKHRTDLTPLTEREAQDRIRLTEGVKTWRANVLDRYAWSGLRIAVAVALLVLAGAGAWRLTHPVAPPSPPDQITNNYYSHERTTAQDLETIQEGLPPVEEGELRVHESYTVFRTVELAANLSVVTGFKYAAPDFSRPESQYCYVNEHDTEDFTESSSVHLGGIDDETGGAVRWYTEEQRDKRQHCRWIGA